MAPSHHHTYYVTSSYILCHIIIHTNPISVTETLELNPKQGGFVGSIKLAQESQRKHRFFFAKKKKSPSATPLADPQDTGSSAGRGRARAAADREANARAEAG